MATRVPRVHSVLDLLCDQAVPNRASHNLLTSPTLLDRHTIYFRFQDARRRYPQRPPQNSQQQNLLRTSQMVGLIFVFSLRNLNCEINVQVP